MVVLSGLSGGVSSPYWSMLILTFFGTSLLLPLRIRDAALLYGIIFLFYVLWMRVVDPERNLEAWSTSLAGLGLSWFVSVTGTGYLAYIRNREADVRATLIQTNKRLSREVEERKRSRRLLYCGHSSWTQWGVWGRV